MRKVVTPAEAEQGARLQWGRNLTVAEGAAALGVVGGSGCFNGAAT